MLLSIDRCHGCRAGGVGADGRDGTDSAAKRAYDVEIVRDAFGVPHINGKTDADAAYGLAYAHSRR